MRCSKCEADVDTDFNSYDFESEVCVDCLDEGGVIYRIEIGTPRFSLIRLFKSILAGIYATAKNWR
ncbi:unnamed protein product [marine sediment metagenome]|uniref:Uncharacterized protein n=1 Tax=marine sediment metagenome TaxID=412755 RepID=X0ZYJ8_9ZZZZ